MHYPANIEFIAPYMPYAAFLIAVFSGLRLAKFNNDTRQTTSFIGLPVPANALFWGSLIVGAHDFLITPACHPVYILILVMLFSWLLVSEIPMFSLKFKNLSWKDNKVSFIFLIICIPLLILLGISGFAAVIVWYIILSLLQEKINKQSFWHVCCTISFKQRIKLIAHAYLRINIHFYHSYLYYRRLSHRRHPTSYFRLRTTFTTNSAHLCNIR